MQATAEAHNAVCQFVFQLAEQLRKKQPKGQRVRSRLRAYTALFKRPTISASLRYKSPMACNDFAFKYYSYAETTRNGVSAKLDNH